MAADEGDAAILGGDYAQDVLPSGVAGNFTAHSVLPFWSPWACRFSIIADLELIGKRGGTASSLGVPGHGFARALQALGATGSVLNPIATF